MRYAERREVNLDNIRPLVALLEAGAVVTPDTYGACFRGHARPPGET
jgi:hypothetical protein